MAMVRRYRGTWVVRAYSECKHVARDNPNAVDQFMGTGPNVRRTLKS